MSEESTSKRRTIAAVSTSRADYGHLYWVLRAMRQDPTLDARLIVIGAHLSPEFGRTVGEVERDGVQVDERIECLLSSDTDVGMAKTIGVAALGLAEVLSRMRPDLLLLIADRYEMLAPAAVALALRIPIAHVEGGEVSEGAIDDAVRNALTKMSHLHFTPSARARTRVLALGEESWRVHQVGAPSLDRLNHRQPMSRDELQSDLGVALSDESILVSYHPVTLADDTLLEIDAVLDALGQLEQQVLFCFPNADAGSRELIRRARRFCDSRPDAELFVNLNPDAYWSLLAHVKLLLGNSSSGIMETASLRLPTVNIGRRQRGRERSANIIDVPAQSGPIVSAVRRGLTDRFRDSLQGLVNPYGDGQAGRRIAEVLADSPPASVLLDKRARPLDDAAVQVDE